ncbi:MAG TPA: response regulator transcription factor [Polyangiaceae bacterium]|nr:response regulator transcription factor [Polyangiaceae bacterium]
MTPAILVIEDEVPMRRVIRTALGGQGYHVWEAGTKRDAISAIAKSIPQAILLDLGLPDGSGLEVLKVVRERSEVPIVIISARGEERDQVLALDSGANDYVTKPFREAELLARLRAALRSAAAYAAPTEERMEIGPLRIHSTERTVYLNGQEVPLTPTEFSLLQVMARQAGRVVTHRHLLREVWGGSYVQDTQYLRVYMRQLRRKLEQDPNAPQLLITTPGVGYRLRAPDA